MSSSVGNATAAVVSRGGLALGGLIASIPAGRATQIRGFSGRLRLLRGTGGTVVEDFRTRPLARASYPYLMLDALELKCRDGGRIVNVCVVHGVAVNRDGYRADESARFRACAAGQVLRFVEPVKVRIRYRRPFLSGAAARLAGLDRRRNSSVPFTLEQLPLLTRGLTP